MNGATVDFAPLLQLLLLAALVASLPLGYVWLHRGGERTRSRLAVLTALTLFLTFDLIVFGAFTRLTDSGLGCPDWPGCYGFVSPIGAREQIAAAVKELPSGPVTPAKAWIEMIHRYLAMTVGALILVLAVASWVDRRRVAISPWWPTATLVWVVVQGLFGKYTVTLKLYPAIVTLHLLGGILLLILLAVQREAYMPRRISVPEGWRAAAWVAALLLLLQIALGGWVSTNYAVLACRGFPDCNGSWWPPMDFDAGFEFLRHLGRTGSGELLSFEALVAIHYVHRAFAVVASLALALLAAGLVRCPDAGARRLGWLLAGLLLLQLASGLSNIVLEWPIVAALVHSGGAAALMLALTLLLTRSRPRSFGEMGS